MTNYDIYGIILISNQTYNTEGGSKMVHLSQIYTISEVGTVSELFYINELAKYLEKRNEQLSLEGVIIGDDFIDTDFFKRLRSNTNVVGLERFEEVAPYDDAVSRIDVSEWFDFMVFKEKTPAQWTFSIADNVMRIRGIYTDVICMSIVAYIAINRLFEGVPNRLHLDFKNDYICSTKTLSSWKILGLYCIMESTMALKTWVKLSIAEYEGVEKHITYEAYKYDTKLRKNIEDFIPAKEKYNYFVKNFKKGDIVFLYGKEEDRGSVTDDIRSIESCHIARIDDFDKNKLVLTVYYVSNSLLDEEKILADLPSQVRSLYDNTSDNVRYVVKNYNWLDIGVDYLTYMEFKFITDLNSSDTVDMWFRKDNGEEVQLHLSSPDGVYAILKERNIYFDEKRFKQLYFSKTPSTYEREILGEEF